MNIVFIVNPYSGKGRGRKVIPIIQNYCNIHNFNPKIFVTEYQKHATELAEEHSKSGIIVSVGGDGTLNEVINGVEFNAPVKIAVLPVGSGNDFSKNLRLVKPNNNKDIEENLSMIFHKEKNETIEVDLMSVDIYEDNPGNPIKHHFINSMGIGFDAYVGFLTNKNKYLKGILAYLLSVIKALIKYKEVDVNIKLNNEFLNGEKLLISLGNGISSGGGFYLTPKAKISDGLINLTAVDKISTLRILSALPLALFNKIDKVEEAKQFKKKSRN